MCRFQPCAIELEIPLQKSCKIHTNFRAMLRRRYEERRCVYLSLIVFTVEDVCYALPETATSLNIQ